MTMWMGRKKMISVKKKTYVNNTIRGVLIRGGMGLIRGNWSN